MQLLKIQYLNNNIANTTCYNSENSNNAILMNDAGATLTVENCQFIGSEMNIFYDSNNTVTLVNNTGAFGDVVDPCLAGTKVYLDKQYGNDTDSCLDSLIDNCCLEWDCIMQNDIFVHNDNLNIACGIFNASRRFAIIHDNYWSTFSYTIQEYDNNSKELTILRAEPSNMFDLSTTGIDSNWPWTYLRIKDLTYYPYHGLNQRMIYRYANDIVTLDNVVIDCSSYDGDSGSTYLVYMDGVQTNYGGQNGNLYVKDLDMYDCVSDYTMFNVRWNVDIYFENINIGLRNNIANYYNNDDINFKFVYVRDNTYVKISNFYIQDYHTSSTITLDRNDLSELPNITMQGV